MIAAFFAFVLAVATATPGAAWQPVHIGGIAGRAYGTPRASHPILFVVLHGDAPNENPTYQYYFAEHLAHAIPGAVAVALLRPGYADGEGAQSQGTHGLTTGDNYTPEDVDAIDAAIGRLRSTYRPSRVILVGHSGGAAIAADILGRHPSSTQDAFLVGCPCDVPAWRSYMMQQQQAAIWNQPVRSISPLTLVARVPQTSRVELIVGQLDDVAPERFSDAYAAALKQHGVDARVVVAPNRGHNILNDDFVLTQLETFVHTAHAGSERH